MVPGVPDNNPATLAVRGWYGSSDYGYASGMGNSGRTYVWDQFSGSWDPNSGLAPTGPTLDMPWPLEIGFAIPEPIILTLAILGSGLFLGASRIKSHRE